MKIENNISQLNIEKIKSKTKIISNKKYLLF